MSAITDRMEADLTALFLADFGEDGTYLPQGAGSGFPARLVFADAVPTLSLGGGVGGVDSTVEATGQLAVLRTGIATATTVNRDPGLGDTWTCASGTHRGQWRVEASRPDVGGGCILRLHQNTTVVSGPAAGIG